MKNLKVLSLFDGISAGRVALERAGIPVESYHASELDKYPIKVTQANWPDTIQIGDVTKWREWDIPQPDLIIGGSPCQGFSFAGKQLNFDDPRSKLFFEFADIVKHYKPKWFLLENVKMKKEYQNIISEVLGVQPIEINSALVSAQNRKRLYWTNIPNVNQPEDTGILLRDILESDGGGVIKNHDEWNSRGVKSMCVDANYHKGVDNYGQRTMIKCGRVAGRKINPETGKRDDYNTELKTKQRFEPRLDNKTGTLTTVQKDNVLAMSYNRKDGLTKELNKSHCLSASDWRGLNRNQNQTAVVTITAKDKNPIITDEYLKFDPNGKGHGSQCNRVNLPDSKHKSLSGTQGGNKPGVVTDAEEFTYRKLTTVECCRLQTFPDDYFVKSGVSNTQIYKALGNSWTVDVIAHIFRGLDHE